MPNVLVLGSGGREHVIVWKLAQNKGLKVYAAPGNPGTAQIAQNVDIDLRDFNNVVAFVEKIKIDLTVPGSEALPVAGIVDRFNRLGLEKKGHYIFGPTSNVCLEDSKVEQKKVARFYGIPTAESEVFTSPSAAKAYLHSKWSDSRQFVIKADGLCKGKGVIVPNSLEEAVSAVDELRTKTGKAADKILVEEKLVGEEISVTAFCDGKNLLMLPASQDHKRLLDGDNGPNTGGMGAYAPVPTIYRSLMAQIEEDIVRKIMLNARFLKSPYRGVIYAGVMLTQTGPKLLEVNCRFGDPEAQALLPLMRNDLYEVMMACVTGTLDKIKLQIDPGAACCVVLASKGYPGDYEKLKIVQGLSDLVGDPNIMIFHAGTRISDGIVSTNGGRVLGVTAKGSTLKEAIDLAYAGVGRVQFEGMHYRKDIGAKGLRI